MEHFPFRCGRQVSGSTEAFCAAPIRFPRCLAVAEDGIHWWMAGGDCREFIKWTSLPKIWTQSLLACATPHARFCAFNVNSVPRYTTGQASDAIFAVTLREQGNNGKALLWAHMWVALRCVLESCAGRFTPRGFQVPTFAGRVREPGELCVLLQIGRGLNFVLVQAQDKKFFVRVVECWFNACEIEMSKKFNATEQWWPTRG